MIELHIISGDYLTKVIIEDTLFYLLTPPGIVTVNISDPTNPSEVSSVGTMTTYTVNFFKKDNYLYCCGFMLFNLLGGYATIYQVSNSLNPILISEVAPKTNNATSGVSLWVRDNYGLFLIYHHSNSTCELKILNLSDLSNVDEISSCQFPVPTYERAELGSYFNIAIQSNYAFVSAGDSGFYIIDLSDPSNPVKGKCRKE